MRSMSLVPLNERGQLIPEFFVVVGHQQFPRALVLDRPDQPLDHRDTALFLNRAVTPADLAPATPATKALVGELTPMHRREK